MEEHCFEVDEEATQAAGEAGQRAAEALKQRSAKNTGRYSKGWAATAEASESGIDVTVHNKTAPGLTHLLEKGHAIVNQHGSYGRTSGDGVIAEVAEEVGAEFEGRFAG